MSSFNRVIILGNLCRDPELRKTPSGASVVELRMAVNDVYKNRTTGERIDKTNFIDVIVWNQQADICHQYLSKGRPLLVEGRLTYDEWKTPQGETRSRLRITAERIQFVNPRPQGAGGASLPPAAPATNGAVVASSTPPPAAPAESEPPMPMDPTNDDPPF